MATSMKLKQQLRNDRQTLARLNTKQRWLFLWDYYKLPIVSVLLILVLAVTGIAAAARSARTAFYAVMINANNAAEVDPFTPLLEQGGMDMTGKGVDIEANYTLQYDDASMSDAQTLQVLAALFGIGDLDVFVANEEVFASYTKQNAFVDLSLFVAEDVLKQYEDQLYYSENQDGEPILSGIWLKEGSALHEAGYYSVDVLLGVAANAQNMEPAVLMVQQLLQSGKV